MSGFIVSGATLVDASGSRDGSLRVEGERIAEVLGPEVDASTLRAVATRHAATIVDGKGLWVLPGGVDPHVHFSLPVAGTMTADDFTSGSAAALSGGTTCFVDFVTPPRGGSLVEATEKRLEEASASLCDFTLHASVTGWSDAVPRELRECKERFGLRSVKLYMAYLDSIGLGEGELTLAMESAADAGLTVLVHCEDGEEITRLQSELFARGALDPSSHPISRPPITEERAVRAALELSRRTGATPYLVHLSAEGSVEAVRRAREGGQSVLAETCPQYLVLDESRYGGDLDEAAACVMSPPLRSRRHRDALLTALAEGTFSTVGSDHCSFHSESKLRRASDFTRIPGGAAGVQHRLSILFTVGVSSGLIEPHEWVRLVSLEPARIFGLYPRKGTLEVGGDADIVLWDPKCRHVIRASEDEHKADHSVYEGMEVVGRPVRVWARGSLMAASDERCKVAERATPGRGRFLGRSERPLV